MRRRRGSTSRRTRAYSRGGRTPARVSPQPGSGRKGAMGGNNTITGWYWPNHITPPKPPSSSPRGRAGRRGMGPRGNMYKRGGRVRRQMGGNAIGPKGYGGNNTITGWYWPNHITPPSDSPTSIGRGGRGGSPIRPAGRGGTGPQGQNRVRSKNRGGLGPSG